MCSRSISELTKECSEIVDSDNGELRLTFASVDSKIRQLPSGDLRALEEETLMQVQMLY